MELQTATGSAGFTAQRVSKMAMSPRRWASDAVSAFLILSMHSRLPLVPMHLSALGKFPSLH